MPSVVVVLVNYRGWQDTTECLSSLIAMDYRDIGVVVVDNASPDNSYQRITSCLDVSFPMAGGFSEKLSTRNILSFPDISRAEVFFEGGIPIIVAKTVKNGGFAYGANIGMAIASEYDDCRYFWILNNDTLVEKDSLRFLVERMESSGEVEKLGIVGGKLKYYDRRNIIQGVGGAFNRFLGVGSNIGSGEPDHGQYDDDSVSHRMDYVIGACMLVRREFFEDVGPMCEDYFLYYEEIDWALRGKRKGWSMAYSWRAVVYHKEGATINPGGEEKSVLSDYYWLRNRVKFTRRFYPAFLPFVLLGFIPVVINRIRRRQLGRLWDVLLGRVPDNGQR